MPVTLAQPVTIRTVDYKSWHISYIHYDFLNRNEEAVCELGIEQFDSDGNLVEKRPIKILIAELAAKYPALYASMKQAHYSEAAERGNLASGTLT